MTEETRDPSSTDGAKSKPEDKEKSEPGAAASQPGAETPASIDVADPADPTLVESPKSGVHRELGAVTHTLGVVSYELGKVPGDPETLAAEPEIMPGESILSPLHAEPLPTGTHTEAPKIASVLDDWKEKSDKAAAAYANPLGTSYVTAGDTGASAPLTSVPVADLAAPVVEIERVPIESALANGWQYMSKNILLLFTISTLAGLVMAVPMIVHFFIKDIVLHNFFLQACLFFYGVLIPVLYHMGRMKVMLRFNRAEPFTSDDFVTVAPLILHYILLLICRGVVVGVGYLFFIVPGVYLHARLDYADYFVIDHRQSAFAAIGNSWRITKDSVLMIILFAMTCGLIEAIGFVLLIIGAIPAKWMTGIAKAYVYDRLRATASGANTEPVIV